MIIKSYKELIVWQKSILLEDLYLNKKNLFGEAESLLLEVIKMLYVMVYKEKRKEVVSEK